MSLQTKLVTGGVQGDTLQDVDCSGGYIPRRYVFTLCGFCAVTICMVASTVSLVIVPISRELGWSDATKGVVLSGYYYGYSPCCAVGGALALRFNRPTAQVLLLPLATTALLQLALPSLVMHLKDVPCLGLASCSEVGMFVVLMLTGMVQATLNPALHRMISVWSPVAERSAQHNFIYSGQQAGQMIGLATGGLIIDGLGWRAVFYINAAALGSFALVWAALVADSPRLHSGCSRQETAMIETDAGEPHGTVGICSMPWGQILRTPAVLVLFVNHWVMGWSSSTIQSWTPTWLTEELHFDIKSSGFVSALPPLIGFGVSTLSGLLATHLITTGKASVSAVRKVSQCGATLAAAVPLILMVYIPGISPAAAVSMMMVSYGLNSLQYSGFHVNHIDLTPKYAPLLYGVTNSIANTAGVISPALYGHILGNAAHATTDGSESSAAGVDDVAGMSLKDRWQLVFTISAGIQVVGGVLWLLGSSGEKQRWG